MPNATLATKGILAKAGLKNGPLPAFPAATPEGAAFWAGYALAPADPSGTAPVPSRLHPAFKAGRRRRVVEPGIDNGTDPRAKLPAAPRVRF